MLAVNRRTFYVKNGQMEEAVALLKVGNCAVHRLHTYFPHLYFRNRDFRCGGR